jgi:hypothetical protein
VISKVEEAKERLKTCEDEKPVVHALQPLRYIKKDLEVLYKELIRITFDGD